MSLVCVRPGTNSARTPLQKLFCVVALLLLQARLIDTSSAAVAGNNKRAFLRGQHGLGRYLLQNTGSDSSDCSICPEQPELQQAANTTCSSVSIEAKAAFLRTLVLNCGTAVCPAGSPPPSCYGCCINLPDRDSEDWKNMAACMW